MIKMYGNAISTVYSDTDSLVYEIRTNNFFNDLRDKLLAYFDTFNSLKVHYCFSDRRKNQPGYFKDEMKDKILLKFVTWRPKLYAYKVEENKIKKVIGIKKYVGDKNINFDQYLKVLNSYTQNKTNVTETGYRHMNCMQSNKYFVYLKTITKLAPSANDDKRIILPDGINTYAHGHYKNKKLDFTNR